MSQAPRSYYILDDHPLLIEGLKKALAFELPSWRCMGDSTNFEQALQFLQRVQPQVVLIDHYMGERNGIDLITALKGVIPACSFILISQLDSKNILQEYFQKGVLGFVAKKDNPLEIVKAIQIVTEKGESYLSPTFETLIRSFDAKDLLTPRELEVVCLIAQGKTNKDVGRDLDCSEFTIKTHKTNIMRKLNINNSVELSVWALKNNVLK